MTWIVIVSVSPAYTGLGDTETEVVVGDAAVLTCRLVVPLDGAYVELPSYLAVKP